MDRYIDLTRIPGALLPSNLIIELVYEHTKTGSPLRKAVINVYVGQYIGAHFARDVDEYPGEFVKDVAVKAMYTAPVLKDGDIPSAKSQYHEPTEETSI